MLNIESLIEDTVREGYDRQNAEAKVCQDIVLKAIVEGGLNRNITIKGGVVMRSITGDVRRATQDMDLDFIRYSLDDSSIRRFVEELNCIDGINITITGAIEELSQQEYRGKRVHIRISDQKGNELDSKVDLGVHADHDIKQDNYCFDVCMDDEGASLLVNSKEQIFTEKLRSLMRFGALSTRYKDVFDMCYLSECVDVDRLRSYIKKYILEDAEMREQNMGAVIARAERTFRSRAYRRRIQKATKANWMNIPIDQIFDELITFLGTL